MTEDIKPLNADEEGLLYIGDLSTDLLDNADLIAEIIASDVNTVFCLNWRNASVTMRAGAWAAIFQKELLAR